MAAEEEDNNAEDAMVVVVVGEVVVAPAPTLDEIQDQITGTKKPPHSRRTRQT